MLDFFIIVGLLLGTVLLLFGSKNHLWYLLLFSSVFFLAVGVGVLGTGLQTYVGGNIGVTQVSSTFDDINFSTVSYESNLDSDNNTIVFAAGWLFFALGAAVALLSLKEAAETREAKGGKLF